MGTNEMIKKKSNTEDGATRRDAYIGFAVCGGILVLALILLTVSGFGPYEGISMKVREPTLWDWMDLLIVPVVLALGALWFNKTQKDTELNIAERARAADREIAEKARTADREIAEARQRQATLEAYYDRMTELLLEYNLTESDSSTEVRSIAKARTIAVIRSLDGERNRLLVAFLRASKLIDRDSPIIDLSQADIPNADLNTGNLFDMDLSEANLRGADLRSADLREAMLIMADLSGADLRGANLRGANLKGAELFEADLRGANLSKAILHQATFTASDMRGAVLIQSDLSNASLSGVDLSMAILSEANLDRTNLNDTNLSLARLQGANNWTIEQFDDAKTLQDAFMPDNVLLCGDIRQTGLTYAEWKAQYLTKQGEQGSNQ